MDIAVLVSGGVDSSVALRLLQLQGHSLTAYYLKIWLEDELSFLGSCPWQEDLRYVEAVCKQAGVPLEVISLQKEYWDEVVIQTIAEIKAGRTPNPDILCNQRIKFGAFYNKLASHHSFVASGHYARLEKHDGLATLYTTPDPIKDQTYFLSHVPQAQLVRALFPLGDLAKADVRTLAVQFDLPNKDRKDSQGICFLGKLKFSEFIKYHLGENQGDFIEYETGTKLGMHKGYWYHTIGQRQGSGLGGGPWYVVAKNIEDNTVFISRNYYTQDKLRDTFIITGCNWITQAPASGELLVKLRHGSTFNKAQLEMLPDGNYKVKLAERDQGIAAGQYAAFYEKPSFNEGAEAHSVHTSGLRCLGSGIIEMAGL